MRNRSSLIWKLCQDGRKLCGAWLLLAVCMVSCSTVEKAPPSEPAQTKIDKSVLIFGQELNSQILVTDIQQEVDGSGVYVPHMKVTNLMDEPLEIDVRVVFKNKEGGEGESTPWKPFRLAPREIRVISPGMSIKSQGKDFLIKVRKHADMSGDDLFY